MCYPPSTFDMHVATWICSSAYHVVVNIPHLHLREGLIHCNWKILPCQQEGAKNHNPPCCICIIRVTRKMPGLVGLWVTKQVQMWLSLPLHVETGCYRTPNYKTPYILSLDLHAHSVYMVETVSSSWTCTVFICLAALLSLLTIKCLLSATYHCKKIYLYLQIKMDDCKVYW